MCTWRPGDSVEVWSNSKNNWVTDAKVLQAPDQDCVIEGYSIRRGSVKVCYGVNEKWILPEDVPKVLRRPPREAPASPVQELPRCKWGCGKPVQPGLTRGMKPFDTCCKKCSINKGVGGEHDQNCGGGGMPTASAAPAAAGEAAGEEPEIWLRRMQDRKEVAKYAEEIFREAAGGAEGGSLKSEQAWAAIEERLLRPIGVKTRIAEADKQEHLSHAKQPAGGASARVESLDQESFCKVCEEVLKVKRDEWFPPKLPTKTHSFVRRNPRKVEEVYTFEKQLGKGSFGLVHSVRHKISGEHRVCKRIAKMKGRTGMKVEEIMQEIENMALLDHPNVIKVYEFFEDEDSISQIMEPCRGGELQDQVDAVFRKKKAPMYSEAFICDVIKQTLRALAFMHSKKFLHKDLKPQNIMLVDDVAPKAASASIKVIDFGLTELFKADQTVSDQFGGTLLYMAPEVFRCELTMKSDVWSVGVILYNLITGDFPFIAQWPVPAGKDVEWWQTETSRLIQAPKESFKKNAMLSNGSVSGECVDLLTRLFKKDPSERPDAPECLKHPWFKQFEQTPPQLSVGVTQCLEAYSFQPELKKGLFLLIAHQSTAPALQELRAIFTHFDVNNRGALDKESFRQVLRKTAMSSLSVERVLHALDRDDSLDVNWTEFIAAALCISVCRAEPKVNAAFCVLDEDSDGKVSERDFLAIFAHKNAAARQKWEDGIRRELKPVSRSKEGGPYNLQDFATYMGSHMQVSAGDALQAVS